jgi:4-aminobutyrate aminotransferase/(S)-3-amino-2-methylpropionate transaminase
MNALRPTRSTSQRAEIRTSVPGPRSRALRAREDALLAPGVQGFATMAGIVVEEARGSTVTDVDGNTYIDFIGGIGVNALGHSHPVYVKAIQAQVARASVGSFTSTARVELLERLARHAPAPGVDRLQLYSGGAEAVESALRLAKCHTGKHEFVSFWGGFHGKTMGALSINGSPLKEKLGPMLPGNHVVPYADPYRHPIAEGASGVACVEMARKQLRAASAGSIAAIVVEPMQGTAGNVIPPSDFLPAVAALAKELDALLIVDEMITGFGRTGRYWGAEHTGVRPDIVTLGKAFGGGFPVSGLLTTHAIAQAKPWSNPSGSSSSYGGNPLAAAAAATSLRIIDEEGLVESSRRVGAHMLAALQPFVERYPFVGHVRGAGLFLGIELVRDEKTKEPLSKTACARLFHACVQRGLLTMCYAPSFRLQPALTIDEATVDQGVDILREVFDLAVAEGFWRD